MGRVALSSNLRLLLYRVKSNIDRTQEESSSQQETTLAILRGLKLGSKVRCRQDRGSTDSALPPVTHTFVCTVHGANCAWWSRSGFIPNVASKIAWRRR